MSDKNIAHVLLGPSAAPTSPAPISPALVSPARVSQVGIRPESDPESRARQFAAAFRQSVQGYAACTAVSQGPPTGDQAEFGITGSVLGSSVTGSMVLADPDGLPVFARQILTTDGDRWDVRTEASQAGRALQADTRITFSEDGLSAMSQIALPGGRTAVIQRRLTTENGGWTLHLTLTGPENRSVQIDRRLETTAGGFRTDTRIREPGGDLVHIRRHTRRRGDGVFEQELDISLPEGRHRAGRRVLQPETAGLRLTVDWWGMASEWRRVTLFLEHFREREIIEADLARIRALVEKDREAGKSDRLTLAVESDQLARDEAYGLSLVAGIDVFDGRTAWLADLQAAFVPDRQETSGAI